MSLLFVITDSISPKQGGLSKIRWVVVLAFQEGKSYWHRVCGR